MKRLLMVAYHFPPLAGSSGIQRTLRFAQHLPALGWEPLVLTCTTGAYESINADLLTEIPADMVVRRAGALDTARHLALGGRYLSALARPDRWMTWRFDGVRQGLQLIRQFQPAAIWSTYPIATAHVIGAALQRHSGLPWVADFRDPMAQEGYPEDPRTWQAFHLIESQAMRQAAVSTFTTPSAVRSYRQRYPDAAGRIVLLENGYDEGSFEAAEKAANQRAPLEPGGLTLLHSGIVYPSERNPTHLIAALRLLHDAGHIQPGRLRLRFRAPVHETLLNELAQRFGVQDYVETCAPVGYREALSEMLRADALLVMQAANCNEQIPAKVYEYLRAGRPVLCLSDPAGDTATTLRSTGLSRQAALDDAPAIATLIQQFVADADRARLNATAGYLPTAEAVANASRRGRARQLTALLNELPSTR